MSAVMLFFDIDNAALSPFLTHARPLLGLLILLLILFNYKGRRTLIAGALSAVLLSLLVLKSYFFVPLLPDWIVYLGFFFAIWYNGNFLHVIRLFKPKHRRLEN